NLSAGDQKLELLRRAHDLALHAGDDGAREQVLRDILREEPQDKMALRTLGELRESAGDHQEAYDLLLRQAELEAEPGALRALRVRAAEIARDQLGKRAEATRILGTIFEENPEDPEVAD